MLKTKETPLALRHPDRWSGSLRKILDGDKRIQSTNLTLYTLAYLKELGSNKI